MMSARAGTSGPLRWAAINHALEGEDVSGDHFVVRVARDAVWVAVIDGLGHGREAAQASEEAARVLETSGFGSVDEALASCHAALASTRGAVMTIAHVRAGLLSWVGIGNVEAALVRSPGSNGGRARLGLYGGVVGHSLPSFRAATTSLARGDLLVLVTDGLRTDALEHVDLLGSPQSVVEGLMARSRTGRDDALAFAARYDGASA